MHRSHETKSKFIRISLTVTVIAAAILAFQGCSREASPAAPELAKNLETPAIAAQDGAGDAPGRRATNLATLALGATAEANGEFPHWVAGPMQAEFAIDESDVSYWAGLEYVSPQVLTITLPRRARIDRIVILERNPASYFTRARFEYFDGKRWKPLFDKTKSSASMDESFHTVVASKVRITVEDLAAPASWYNKVTCIHAFEIYGHLLGRPLAEATRS